MKTIETTAEIILTNGTRIHSAIWTDGQGQFCFFQNKRLAVQFVCRSESYAVYKVA